MPARGVPMSFVDQQEIDALLQEASALSAAAGGGRGNGDSQPKRPALVLDGLPPAIRRLLRIKVSIIVELARRRITIGAARNLSPGSIIEFTKSAEDELDMLANNQHIGKGLCVKVGENFGLRVTRILDRTARLKTLAKGD